MRKRAAGLLCALLLVAATTSPADCRAEDKRPRVGILFFRLGMSSEETRLYHAPFRDALARQGLIEGQNVEFEYPRDSGDPSRFAAAAADLVRLKVDVIWAESAPAVRAAHEATRTIPIVGIDFTNDPVAAGYAESHGRPGANVTGVFLDAPEFAGKWFELLKAILPKLSRVAVLWDPSPGTAHLQAVQSVARSLHLKVQVVEVHTPGDIDTAFLAFRGRPQALVILPSPMLYQHSELLAKQALKHKLPATSMAGAFAESCGVIAYGPSRPAVNERAAIFIAKILAGAKPGELPVERPSKFELVVNLRSARSLGLTVPESVLLQADEVIR